MFHGIARSPDSEGDELHTDVSLAHCPMSVVWLIALFEGIAVPAVAALAGSGGASSPKAPGHGLAAGFLSMFAAVILANRWLPRLRVSLAGCAMTTISPFAAATWNALFLEAIFTIQRLVRQTLPDGGLAAGAWLGFVSVAGSLAIVALMYNLASRVWPPMAIRVGTDGAQFRLATFTVWPWAIFAGLYEAIAFPVINLWQLAPHGKVLAALATGAAGGGLAAGLIRALYNRTTRLRCGFRFVRLPQGAQAPADHTRP